MILIGFYMQNKPTIESLLLKYKDVPKGDFLIAQIAAKLDVFEVILIERLYPDPAARLRAFAQLDADRLSLLENYLQLLQAGKDSAPASGESGDQSASNN